MRETRYGPAHMARRWSWDTTDSEWSVTLDLQAGVLHWLGADQPQPGVSRSCAERRCHRSNPFSIC